MLVVVFTSILALFLTFLESKKNIKGGMKWGFVLLTFLLCIHYDYGNDYMAYYSSYEEITRFPIDFSDIFDGSCKEPGWILISYIFKPLGGFFVMVAVLNIVQNILIYKVIKHYVPKNWWLMSVFIYVFYTSLYIMSFSMMRQSFVICVFLGILPLIEKRRIILATFILFLCSTIHTSALFLLPFALIGYLPIRWGKLLALVFCLFYLAICIGGSFINDIFSLFIIIDKFSDYAEIYSGLNDKTSFGVGFILNQVTFVLSLLYLYNNDTTNQTDKIVVVLSLIGFVLLPFTSIVPIISRLGMYFVAYQMIAVPIIYRSMRNVVVRYGAMFLLIFMTVYDYFVFFYSPIYHEKYFIFKTIFSEIFW